MAHLSEDDIARISQDCLKDTDFIKKFQEAVGGKDIPDAEKDPEGHAKFLSEIQGRMIEMAMKEKEGEVFSDDEGTWGYTLPVGVFCIKATDESGRKKIFINVCKSEAIQEPMPMTTAESEESGIENKDLQFRVPISIGPCRVDKDKAGHPAAVYDIAVNPLTLDKCSQDPEFKRLVCAMCLYGLKQKHEPDLNADQYKQPNLKCKGQPVVQRVRLTRAAASNAFNNEIRTPDTTKGKSAGIEVIGERKAVPGEGTNVFYESTKVGDDEEEAEEEVSGGREVDRLNEGSYDWSVHKKPELNAYWRARTDVPAEITLKIHLPEVSHTIAECYVDVTPTKVSIYACDDDDHEKPYFTEELRFPIDDEAVTAKFGKKKKMLELKLKVKLPDEITQKEALQKATREEEEKELQAEEARIKQEQDEFRRLKEKNDRVRKEEEAQQEFNKKLVETAKAMQSGALPPELKDMIDTLPPEEAKTLLGRLMDGRKRGDSVDGLLEKLPPEAVSHMVDAIREKLGLAPPPVKQKEDGKVEVDKKQLADADAEDEEHTFGFHKMSKKLFGVDVANRFLFALDL
eukprot:TRINITY_DN24509_c0_g1_i1.p1 TRINITY_DN24509_c0_g1~~TRINITY_DN24509_c0_g1_i1.p1  ORF type:complete len:579 (+),score=133.05 TRINITY_DN24509_c0_g1_i1:24-1739(+)